MDVGSTYHNSNQFQASSAFVYINKVKDLLREKYGKKKCKLLDIGTGDGRILSEVFVKTSGLIFEKIVGVDINNEMLNVAKKTYENDLTTFEILDIQDEEKCEEFLKIHNQFDIATAYVSSLDFRY